MTAPSRERSIALARRFHELHRGASPLALHYAAANALFGTPQRPG